MADDEKKNLLKLLPGVDHILKITKRLDRFKDIPRKILLGATRSVLEKMRKNILENVEVAVNEENILDDIYEFSQHKIAPRLVRLVNATGVVLHTNMGRALLCKEALDNIIAIASSYSNLEFNIKKGKRGSRYEAVEEIICELTGAQAAVAVNNNAGAVLLALNTLATGHQVIVSRGELVEIGGSFRIPDVMTKSGCILKEVGTTNRTHPRDYENAITSETALLLKVHASNYRIDGFSSSVSLNELVHIGNANNIRVMEDLGSGTLIDFSKYGLANEPTVSDSISSGADVVTFSGDKLLGGPQAGIIAGKKNVIEEIKANPLTRALRIDKLTLAALESTLKIYLDEEDACRTLPTLKMLTAPYKEISKKADSLFKMINSGISSKAEVETADLFSRPGGGSFPELELPTRCILIKPYQMSVASLEKKMRLGTVSIIGRIEDDKYIIDPRTIQEGEDTIIVNSLKKIFSKVSNDK